MPKAEVSLIEDGFATPVARAGHGTQRAFVMSLLQELAASRQSAATSESRDDEGSSEEATLLLVIEEPELYQHPNRQRSMSASLSRLTETGVEGNPSSKAQVLYATHSPHFVRLDRFHQLRVLRKVKEDAAGPRSTKVFSVSGDKIAAELWEANGRPGGTPYTWDSLRPRMSAMMTTEVGEGVFADIIVLVEGESDKAAILASASAHHIDLAASGVSVLSANGKGNISKILLVFNGLGLPTYVVWDGDDGASDANERKNAIAQNRTLLSLVGQEPVDWPQTTVESRHATFRTNLESTCMDELGDLYSEVIDECRSEFGLARDRDVRKLPAFMERLVNRARERGQPLTTVENIALRIAGIAAALDNG